MKKKENPLQDSRDSFDFCPVPHTRADVAVAADDDTDADAPDAAATAGVLDEDD